MQHCTTPHMQAVLFITCDKHQQPVCVLTCILVPLPVSRPADDNRSWSQLTAAGLSLHPKSPSYVTKAWDNCHKWSAAAATCRSLANSQHSLQPLQCMHGACMLQTCLRAGATWCDVFTVYSMLVPIFFYNQAQLNGSQRQPVLQCSQLTAWVVSFTLLYFTCSTQQGVGTPIRSQRKAHRVSNCFSLQPAMAIQAWGDTYFTNLL
jgi:hypothetical protein